MINQSGSCLMKNSCQKGKSMNGKENGLKAAFREGDLKTKLSFLIMGFGNLANRQIVKGLLFLAVEAAFIVYMVQYGAQAIWSLRNLGDTQ